jgi:hypothetical protein
MHAETALLIGDGFLFEIVMVTASGGVIFASWFRSSRQWIRRKLRRLKRSNLGEVEENTLVRLVGTVKQLDKIVTAPVSGVPCVYYQVKIDIKHDGWKTKVHEAHGAPFLLEDETGYAIIEPSAAHITTKHLRFFPADHPDLVLDRFLARHHLLQYKYRLRILEMLIEPGTTITVMGSGVGERDPIAAHPEGYRAERTTCLRFTGSKRHPLVISDDPTLR